MPLSEHNLQLDDIERTVHQDRRLHGLGIGILSLVSALGGWAYHDVDQRISAQGRGQAEAHRELGEVRATQRAFAAQIDTIRSDTVTTRDDVIHIREQLAALPATLDYLRESMRRIECRDDRPPSASCR